MSKTPNLNQTHDPQRRSWVESANTPNCDFPIQNLPYGIFSNEKSTPRLGVAIGEYVLDLARIAHQNLNGFTSFSGVFDQPSLNRFMALGPNAWETNRKEVSDLLCFSSNIPSSTLAALNEALVPLSRVKMHLPFEVAGFTDFYASKEHATNVGTMFRDPENALMPNWLHIPIGYNGRASTVVVSGTDIHRPIGQIKAPDWPDPKVMPSQKLDFELELGTVVGTGSKMGFPVSTEDAYDMIFGFVLLNDWSARDIQVWEYQPLGPFQSKAFATSISPWVVTRSALEPFRVPTPKRLKPLLPYLHENAPYNYDLQLEVALNSSRICQTNQRGLYYSAPQQLAHHTLSGCNMKTGDLLGSGTISGSTPDSLGSLLELTWNGQRPLSINGQTRQFLENGDMVSIKGWCQAKTHRIGFGACEGKVLPAHHFIQSA